MWRCDTRCDLKKVDGIIRHGRFRSGRASVSVSLSYKLVTERMYSNNESFLPDKVKRNELQRTRGEGGRESEYYKEAGNQTVCADGVTWLVSEYQVQAFFLWWIHFGWGEMMYPSFLTAMMMPSECEREADGSLRIDRPLLPLLHMMEREKDESVLTIT